MSFLLVAVPLTMAAAALVAVPLVRRSPERAPIAAVLVALAIPACAALLYAGISTYPWQTIAAAPTSRDSPAISALKERVDQAPADTQAWVDLGDGYAAAERFADARDAYREAIRLSGGGDDNIRLAFAEASILLDRSALTGEAGQIVDEVLARDPVNAKALWYGGMAALSQGNADVARARWSRLLELSPPPQVREVIEQQLARLSGSGEGEQARMDPGSATRIPVLVTVRPELAGRIRPGASLFLIARDPGGTGPPLAVVRRTAATLPMDLEISDADSMVPGRTMAALSEIKLTARMANGGDALAAAGDVFGEVLWNRSSASGARVELEMDQIVK